MFSPLFVDVVNPQAIPHVPSWVVFGDIQHLEVILVPLYLGPLDYLEAHGNKGVADLPQDLGGWMQTTPDDRTTRHCNVKLIFLGKLGYLGVFKVSFLLSKLLFEVGLGPVRQSSQGPALFLGESAEASEDAC